MSESSTIEVNGGQLQDFTIDQFAGATALILGSFGGLLMIIWKSRCACRMRVGCSDKCYVFDCERKPPPDEGDSDDEEKKDKNKERNNKRSNGQSPKKNPNPDETLIPPTPTNSKDTNITEP